MKDSEWAIVKQCAACADMPRVPAGFIADSPWIPGYCGVDTIDFYADTQLWLNCYEKVKRDFPDMLMFPDYWVEWGMAAEPSAFGCKPNFYHDQPVMISHLIDSIDDIEQIVDLPVPDPRKDGLMPLALSSYKRIKSPLREQGQEIRMVASRGPLNIATFLMSVPEFCMGVKIDPDNIHKLLKTTTALVKRWLYEQMAVLDGVEGILVLDDICGFLSEADYLEFAQPYLKDVFSSFDLPVKMFHNDNFGNKYATFPHIAALGVNIFNFSHMADIAEARKWLGPEVCIMGNVPTLGVLTKGTPEESAEAATACLDRYGSRRGIILSGGGGISPGMPQQNCRAMLQALDAWNARR